MYNIAMSKLSDPQLQLLDQELEALDPQQSLQRLFDIFGDGAALSSSFGSDSMGLIHMATCIKPDVRIMFIDTGWHFPETLAFRDEMTQTYKLNLHIYKPELEHDQFVKEHGHLYEVDPDRCCAINKVEPMQRAIKDVACWISGVRRSQAATRAQTPNIEKRPSGLIKAYPINRLSTRQVYEYMQAHKLPHHPLWDKGYVSIGCAPCTQSVTAGENERAGRWVGKNKIECGLHTQL